MNQNVKGQMILKVSYLLWLLRSIIRLETITVGEEIRINAVYMQECGAHLMKKSIYFGSISTVLVSHKIRTVLGRGTNFGLTRLHSGLAP